MQGSMGVRAYSLAPPSLAQTLRTLSPGFACARIRFPRAAAPSPQRPPGSKLGKRAPSPQTGPNRASQRPKARPSPDRFGSDLNATCIAGSSRLDGGKVRQLPERPNHGLPARRWAVAAGAPGCDGHAARSGPRGGALPFRDRLDGRMAGCLAPSGNCQLPRCPACSLAHLLAGSAVWLGVSLAASCACANTQRPRLRWLTRVWHAAGLASASRAGGGGHHCRTRVRDGAGLFRGDHGRAARLPALPFVPLGWPREL